MKVCNSSPRLNVRLPSFFVLGLNAVGCTEKCCGLHGVRSAERQDVVTLCMNFFPTFANTLKSFPSHSIPSLEIF